MGTTGNSSGKHLHLGLCEDGNYIDPVASREDRELIGDFQWPIKNRESDVSRRRPTGRRSPRRGRPGRTPRSPRGTRRRAGRRRRRGDGMAIGDGEMIYRGYSYGSGYTVMIKHSDGLISSYRHMRPF